jgi:hypothetical protein
MENSNVNVVKGIVCERGEKSDKIKSMIRYIQMWRLVRFIYKRRMKKSTYLSKRQVLEEIMRGNSPAIGKEWLVENYAKRHFTTETKIESLLIECSKNKFTEDVESPLGILIRTTPEGDHFASHGDMLQGFFERYDLLFFKVVGPVLGFILGIYGKDMMQWFLINVKF